MLIIGIAGGSGSGKTTVVKAIKEQLNESVVVIPQDSYYKDLSHYTEEQKRVHNFDHPDSIDFDLLRAQLKDLRDGREVEQPVYSYITCGRSRNETVHVKPADVMARDIVERGKTVEWVIERYSNTVKPMYLQFIEPSKRYADIIIPQGGHNKVAIDVISATIEKSLANCKKK